MSALPYCGSAPTPPDLLGSWNLDPWLIAAMALLAAVHWRALDRTHDGGSACTLSAVAAWVILAALFISPLCALSSALFSMRVTHHVVLTAIVAPLLVVSLRLPSIGASSQRLTLIFLLHTAILWLWHLPQPYAAALSSNAVYWLMQMSLLGSAFALWWALLERGAVLPRLSVALGSVMQMGLLGALITFARVPLYQAHAIVTEPWGLSQMEDQQLAGLIMWVPAILPYLAAALLIAGRSLANASASPSAAA